MAEAWGVEPSPSCGFTGFAARLRGLSWLKPSSSAVTAWGMKKSAAELQGDQELIKFLDYKPNAAQVSVALEWLSGISNDDSHVADALMPLLHPNLISSPEAPRTTTFSGA